MSLEPKGSLVQLSISPWRSLDLCSFIFSKLTGNEPKPTYFNNYVTANFPTHLSFINELPKRGPLDFDLVAGSVEDLDHEVEEVGLAEVGRRLLRELDPADATPEKNVRDMNP